MGLEPRNTLSPLKSLWTRPFFRFLVVGFGNTIAGYAVYIVGLWSGLSYPMALTVATVLGACFNFFTTGQIVFNNDKLQRIFAFLGVYVLIYAFNLALLAGFVHVGMAKGLAQGASLPFVVVLSYFMNREVFGRAS